MTVPSLTPLRDDGSMRFETAVLHILADAHYRMDVLGYPPVNRPIDGRDGNPQPHIGTVGVA